MNKQEDRKVVSIERETDSLYVNSSNEVFISENGKPSILLKKVHPNHLLLMSSTVSISAHVCVIERLR